MSDAFQDQLPQLYTQSPEVLSLQATLERIARSLQDDRESLFAQFFVDSATWGLPLWEQAYGLSPSQAASFGARREAIRAALRGSGTCTRSLLMDIAMAYTGKAVNIIEYPGEYRVVIHFIGDKGVPHYIEDFKRNLERVFPSHLIYEFLFTYTNWGELQPRTWGACREKSWETIRLT